MKFFCFVLLSAGLASGFFLYGDEVEIPEHFLAAEAKACKRQAVKITTPERASDYCTCVSTGLAANYQFADYVWRNAEMSLEASKQGKEVSEIAVEDKTLRSIHQHCFQAMKNGTIEIYFDQAFW